MLLLINIHVYLFCKTEYVYGPPEKSHPIIIIMFQLKFNCGTSPVTNHVLTSEIYAISVLQVKDMYCPYNNMCTTSQ